MKKILLCRNCEHCGKTFQNNSSMMDHVRSRHRDKLADPIEAYKCDVAVRKAARLKGCLSSVVYHYYLTVESV